ncbi:hypothetical protein KNP414_02092 [Paenibacillus mucilaginosus KNP414]|uniref:Uncharacterized protein n=1 Tax=Paenibacillus mucilaginosus (strain KNP414) TaxID=1036673 RepID=F8FRU6_PAEMK|nr:hypothetical protein KNP414_02092 [Paenibacillus mucilaginosus KNP414]
MPTSEQIFIFLIKDPSGQKHDDHQQMHGDEHKPGAKRRIHVNFNLRCPY